MIQFKSDPDESASENQSDDMNMDTSETANEADELDEQPMVKVEADLYENANEIDPLRLQTITTVENISKRQTEDVLVFTTTVADVADVKHPIDGFDPLTFQQNANIESASDVNRSQNVPPLAAIPVITDIGGFRVKSIKEINAAKLSHEKSKCSTCEHCAATEKKLKTIQLKYKHLSKRYAKEKKKFQTKRKSVKMSVNLANEIDKLTVSENTKIFSKTILFAPPSCEQLPDNQRDFCRNIFDKSKEIYLFMKNELKLNLPSIVSSFQKCITLSDTKTIGALTRQAKTLDVRGRQCSIIMGATLKNSDDDDEPLQNRIDSVRQPMTANELSFIVRGDFRKWENTLRIPAECATSGEQLQALLFKNLNKLCDIGYVVSRIVCVQTNVNRECFSLLNVTKDKPYIVLDGKKIYCMYDIHNLARECRDTLINDYEYKTVDGLVSWTVVKDMHKLDKLKNAKLCPNITDSHISPSSVEKLNNDLATEVLSGSCASAIEKRLKQQSFAHDVKKKALSTANFFKKFDSLYGHMNSNENVKAITSIKSDDVQKTLYETKMYFSKITCKQKAAWIDDLVQSITAMLMLAKEL